MAAIQKSSFVKNCNVRILILSLQKKSFNPWKNDIKNTFFLSSYAFDGHNFLVAMILQLNKEEPSVILFDEGFLSTVQYVQ